MINTILCILTSLFLANANQITQEPRTISLNIDLSAIAERPELMIIKKHGLGEYEVKADTNKIAAAKFTRSSILPEPEIQDVIFIWSGGKRKSASFRAFPSSYRVTFDNSQKLVIENTGNTTQSSKDFDELEKLISNNRSEANRLIGRVDYENRKIESVELEINKLRDSMEMVLDEKIYHPFILNHLKSPAGLYALTKYAERPLEKQRRKWSPDEIQKLMSQIHPSLKKTPTFRLLAEKLLVNKNLSVGNKLQNISLLDTAGRSINISDFRGKYLLVEFWASWCGPCRQESPRLIHYFKKYQSKGFNIVGITLNKLPEKKGWLKAIKDDGVGIWPQLSDFDDIAQKTYDIKVIPSNFLLDPDGIIIAFDLRGNDLENKLKEIMKN